MKRREFVSAAAVGGAGLTLGGKAWAGSHDLVLKNVNALINGVFKKCDIGVAGDKISAVSDPGALSGADELACDGLYASPGWVDLHTHYVTKAHGKFIGTSTKRLGTVQGVTVLVDAGTTGPKTFHKLVESTSDDPDVTCKAFVYVTADGIKVRDYLWYKKGWEDLEGVAKTLEKYPKLVVGIKFRADKTVVPKDDPTYYVRKAREAGDLTGLPSMIHIGSPPPTLSAILDILKEGDIVTHCLRSQTNSVVGADGKLLDSVKDAYARGVRFDVGHGVGSFSFETAERALDQGFDDFTISSDLYMLSTPAKARTFANVLTKFIILGMPLEGIMDRASTRPAGVIGLERKIEPGAEAAITVFSMANGDFVCKDTVGKERKSDKRIIPEWTVVKGKKIRAGEFDRKIFL